MSSSGIDISIVIVVKDGEMTIDRVLTSLFRQETEYTFEVIVVDSGSTDQTCEIVGRYSASLYEIPPEKFSHSGTRNLGASHAKAEKYLIFLNADAVPTDEKWLNNMVRSIEYRPDLMAACATELNEREEYFNVTGIASLVFPNSVVEGIHVIEPHVLSKYPHIPKEKLRNLFPFTTVCAIFKKNHFDKYPFDVKVPWAEDLYWVVNNSNLGFSAACSSFARVYHYHDFYGPVGNYIPDVRKNREVVRQVKGNLNRVYKDLFQVDLKDIRKGQIVRMIRRFIRTYIR